MAVGSSGLPSVSAGETEDAAVDEEVPGDLAIASDEEDEEVMPQAAWPGVCSDRRLQEPLVCYTRATGDTQRLLAASAASAIGLCGRLTVVGTRRGHVLLFDESGKQACTFQASPVWALTLPAAARSAAARRGGDGH